jgi:hypothetical protein
MKVFQLIKTLSKNKASVGDVFIIEGNERTVARITAQDVYMSNGTQYNKKMFNHWMRIDKAVELRDTQSKKYKEKIDQIYEEVTITRKEAKRIYDEKYRQPAINRVNDNERLKTYIVLTGVGNTVKWYFSPTFKADADDLELSYKSLHGTKYCAFAYGFYIQYNNDIALIGMHSYKERNLSDKRKAFALECLKQTQINGHGIRVALYQNMAQIFDGELLDMKSRLLSSTTLKPKPSNRHWSGLNGDIAQDMVDQGLSQMLENDDMPF